MFRGHTWEDLYDAHFVRCGCWVERLCGVWMEDLAIVPFLLELEGYWGGGVRSSAGPVGSAVAVVHDLTTGKAPRLPAT